jgi:hypothetical protein
MRKKKTLGESGCRAGQPYRSGKGFEIPEQGCAVDVA